MGEGEKGTKKPSDDSSVASPVEQTEKNAALDQSNAAQDKAAQEAMQLLDVQGQERREAREKAPKSDDWTDVQTALGIGGVTTAAVLAIRELVKSRRGGPETPAPERLAFDLPVRPLAQGLELRDGKFDYDKRFYESQKFGPNIEVVFNEQTREPLAAAITLPDGNVVQYVKAQGNLGLGAWAALDKNGEVLPNAQVITDIRLDPSQHTDVLKISTIRDNVPGQKGAVTTDIRISENGKTAQTARENVTGNPITNYGDKVSLPGCETPKGELQSTWLRNGEILGAASSDARHYVNADGRPSRVVTGFGSGSMQETRIAYDKDGSATVTMHNIKSSDYSAPSSEPAVFTAKSRGPITFKPDGHGKQTAEATWDIGLSDGTSVPWTGDFKTATIQKSTSGFESSREGSLSAVFEKDFVDSPYRYSERVAGFEAALLDRNAGVEQIQKQLGLLFAGNDAISSQGNKADLVRALCDRVNARVTDKDKTGVSVQPALDRAGNITGVDIVHTNDTGGLETVRVPANGRAKARSYADASDLSSDRGKSANVDVDIRLAEFKEQLPPPPLTAEKAAKMARTIGEHDFVVVSKDPSKPWIVKYDGADTFSDIADRALDLAQSTDRPLLLDFNGSEIPVNPKDKSGADVTARLTEMQNAPAARAIEERINELRSRQGSLNHEWSKAHVELAGRTPGRSIEVMAAEYSDGANGKDWVRNAVDSITNPNEVTKVVEYVAAHSPELLPEIAQRADSAHNARQPQLSEHWQRALQQQAEKPAGQSAEQKTSAPEMSSADRAVLEQTIKSAGFKLIRTDASKPWAVTHPTSGHLSEGAERVAALAKATNREFMFSFNGDEIPVKPGDTRADVEASRKAVLADPAREALVKPVHEIATQLADINRQIAIAEVTRNGLNQGRSAESMREYYSRHGQNKNWVTEAVRSIRNPNEMTTLANFVAGSDNKSLLSELQSALEHKQGEAGTSEFWESALAKATGTQPPSHEQNELIGELARRKESVSAELTEAMVAKEGLRPGRSIAIMSDRYSKGPYGDNWVRNAVSNIINPNEMGRLIDHVAEKSPHLLPEIAKWASPEGNPYQPQLSEHWQRALQQHAERASVQPAQPKTTTPEMTSAERAIVEQAVKSGFAVINHDASKPWTVKVDRIMDLPEIIEGIATLAKETNQPFLLELNKGDITVNPGDTAPAVAEKWRAAKIPAEQSILQAKIEQLYEERNALDERIAEARVTENGRAPGRSADIMRDFYGRDIPANSNSNWVRRAVPDITNPNEISALIDHLAKNGETSLMHEVKGAVGMGSVAPGTEKFWEPALAKVGEEPVQMKLPAYGDRDGTAAEMQSALPENTPFMQAVEAATEKAKSTGHPVDVPIQGTSDVMRIGPDGTTHYIEMRGFAPITGSLLHLENNGNRVSVMDPKPNSAGFMQAKPGDVSDAAVVLKVSNDKQSIGLNWGDFGDGKGKQVSAVDVQEGTEKYTLTRQRGEHGEPLDTWVDSRNPETPRHLKISTSKEFSPSGFQADIHITENPGTTTEKPHTFTATDKPAARPQTAESIAFQRAMDVAKEQAERTGSHVDVPRDGGKTVVRVRPDGTAHLVNMRESAPGSGTVFSVKSQGNTVSVIDPKTTHSGEFHAPGKPGHVSEAARILAVSNDQQSIVQNFGDFGDGKGDQVSFVNVREGTEKYTLTRERGPNGEALNTWIDSRTPDTPRHLEITTSKEFTSTGFKADIHIIENPGTATEKTQTVTATDRPERVDRAMKSGPSEAGATDRTSETKPSEHFEDLLKIVTAEHANRNGRLNMSDKIELLELYIAEHPDSAGELGPILSDAKTDQAWVKQARERFNAAADGTATETATSEADRGSSGPGEVAARDRGIPKDVAEPGAYRGEQSRRTSQPGAASEAIVSHQTYTRADGQIVLVPVDLKDLKIGLDGADKEGGIKYFDERIAGAEQLGQKDVADDLKSRREKWAATETIKERQRIVQGLHQELQERVAAEHGAPEKASGRSSRVMRMLGAGGTAVAVLMLAEMTLPGAQAAQVPQERLQPKPVKKVK